MVALALAALCRVWEENLFMLYGSQQAPLLASGAAASLAAGSGSNNCFVGIWIRFGVFWLIRQYLHSLVHNQLKVISIQ